MIKKLRVAVDHGNRNMKTCNHVFTTGLTEMDWGGSESSRN